MQSAEFLIAPAPGPLVTVEEVVTEPDSLLKGHRHPGAHVCVVLDGSFEEQDADGRPRRCERGSIRISPPGRGHRIRFGPGGARCLLFLMPGHAGVGGSRDARGADLFVTDAAITALAATARVEARRGRAESPLVVEAMVVEMMARATAPEPRPTWLDEARRTLDDGFRGPVSLARVARLAGVHRVHLAREFARHFGRSARAHLRALRLAEAARCLAESECPLAEVARRSGFYDQSHLTRAFSARFGRPPGAFRDARRSMGSGAGDGSDTRPTS